VVRTGTKDFIKAIDSLKVLPIEVKLEIGARESESREPRFDRTDIGNAIRYLMFVIINADAGSVPPNT
jgi:hypothetical protein